MIGWELILTFKAEKAYLIPDKELDLRNLDLPDIVHSFTKKVSWLVKVIKYNPDQKLLFVEVLNYFDSEFEFTDFQLINHEIFENIDFINFRTINTSKLLQFIDTEKSNFREEEPDLFASDDFNYTNNPESIIKGNSEKPASKDIVFELNDSFSVAIKDIKFGFGCVSFTKKINGFHDSINFSIINYDIREEFDAVKNYFANILKTKRINVEVIVKITNGEISECKAYSPEIAKINNKLIDSVKFEFVGNFLKKRKNFDIDKSLFTMDEAFAMFNNEKLNSNVFYNSDKDLFDDILQISNTKHYKHLRFLSSKHAYHIMKLRFVLKPFSFIFLIEGEKMYHIIWETLDTEEATYIWHIEKNKELLKLKLNKIEDILNIIKAQGKIAYINTHDENYHRIYHDYSDFIDGFVKWKSELESNIN